MTIKRQFALVGGVAMVFFSIGIGLVWWLVVPACAASKPLAPDAQGAEIGRAHV